MQTPANTGGYQVRTALPAEFEEIGKLMVTVYAQLQGFPSPAEQPAYYEMLAHIGEFTKKPGTELLAAVSPNNTIGGAVVYFSDMKYYGSGGSASEEQDAAAFRLLAVRDEARGQGIGKLLTTECISRARAQKVKQVIIHSTMAMQTAWKMYENLGFKRSSDLDFMQGSLAVYGFRLLL